MEGSYFLPQQHGDATEWQWLSLILAAFQSNNRMFFQVAAARSLSTSHFGWSRQLLLPLMLLSIKIVTLPPISFLILPEQIDWWSLSWETEIVTLYPRHISSPAPIRSKHLFQIQILPCCLLLYMHRYIYFIPDLSCIRGCVKAIIYHSIQCQNTLRQ